MSGEIQDPEAIVKKNLNFWHKKGGFTHGYVAAGNLRRDHPDFEYEVGTPGIRFDLASLTKALYTTPLILADWYQKKATPETSLSEYGGPALRPLSGGIADLTLEKLLSHRSGLPDWKAFWVRCDDPRWHPVSRKEALLQRINLEADYLRPGQGSLYSDLGFILLGMALETRGCEAGDALFENFCKDFLGCGQQGLSFNRTPEEKQNSAPSGYCRVRQTELRGEVHDENASVFDGVCGHAGLFGSGRDLVRFLQDLLNHPFGTYILDTQIKKRTGTQEMTGLAGWQQGGGPGSRVFGGGKAVGHLGFTGTAFWVIPETLSYGILLTNRIISGRTSDWIGEFRKNVFHQLFHIAEP